VEGLFTAEESKNLGFGRVEGLRLVIVRVRGRRRRGVIVVVDLLYDILHQRFRLALMVRHGSPILRHVTRERERERESCVLENEKSVNFKRERVRERDREMKSEPFIGVWEGKG
jgi:hypothetical protein